MEKKVNIIINYPTSDFITNTSPTYYTYLLSGFQELFNIKFSKKLSEESYNIVKLNDPKHLTKIKIEINDKNYVVWHDWSDFKKYNGLIREQNDFYFKAQFTKECQKYQRIFPIGQVIGNMDLIKNLDDLRNVVDKQDYDWDVFALYRTTSYDIRLKAIKLLEKSNLNCYCKLKDFNICKIRPKAPKEYSIKKLIPYLDHAKQLAKSRFVLALPAIDNSTPWRFGEAMAMGIPLIYPESDVMYPGNIENCYIKVEKDLSDLIPKLEYYKEHYDEALGIAKRGKEYFNKWLSPKGMANNIVRTVKNGI